MGIVVTFALTMILGIIFNIKFARSIDSLKPLLKYAGIDFSLVYTDAATQFKVLKRLMSAETELEKNLKVIFLLSVLFFVLTVFQVLVLFANK